MGTRRPAIMALADVAFFRASLLALVWGMALQASECAQEQFLGVLHPFSDSPSNSVDLPPFIFDNRNSSWGEDNEETLSLGVYYEREYPTGWFTSPRILDTRIDSSQLYQMLTQRRHTHYPVYITSHCVERPKPVVLFNVLWVPNANNMGWSLALNLDGTQLQAQLTKLVASGLQPAQIESYAFESHGTIYYSAVFYDGAHWPAGVRFSSVFGVPRDASYCCGAGSRWDNMYREGLRPLSLSVTQDPGTKGMYVADVWSTREVEFWQAGIDKTAGELQALLNSLSPPLVPVFIKSYKQTYSDGSYDMLYSFVITSNTDVASYAATLDISRSGMELIARLLKSPPLFMTSYYSEAAKDPEDPTSGEVYAAVWQSIPDKPSLDRAQTSPDGGGTSQDDIPVLQAMNMR